MLAGTPLKPALHVLHAYGAAGAPPRRTLSEAMRTMLLHRRQVAETRGAEQRRASRAGESACFRADRDVGLASTPMDLGTPVAVDVARSAAHAAPDAGAPHAGTSAAKAGCASLADGAGGVRGAAGSAQAAVAAVRAPKAAAKGNWLTAMSSDATRRRNTRHVAHGRDAMLPGGVVASQASGKLTFPVMYKFHEV
jgi:hypothetical protein